MQRSCLLCATLLLLTQRSGRVEHAITIALPQLCIVCNPTRNSMARKARVQRLGLADDVQITALTIAKRTAGSVAPPHTAIQAARGRSPSRGVSPMGTRPGVLQSDGTVRMSPGKATALVGAAEEVGSKPLLSTPSETAAVADTKGGRRFDQTW